LSNQALEKGTVEWRSPSNIAIVKYWGKKQFQIPTNPSLSFSLSNCFTQTSIEFEKTGKFELNYSFQGNSNAKFTDRINKYIQRLSLEAPALKEYKFTINSKNSFPHSAGIASSASSFSALALGLVNILFPEASLSSSRQKASDWSRQGSGSASRSVYGGFCLWGCVNHIQGSSDFHAMGLDMKKGSFFNSLQDAILIVDHEEKAVSSSVGHDLMINHVFHEQRIKIANNNVSSLLTAIAKEDFKLFGSICEEEALMLHALMMTSKPPYILMKPRSILFMEKIKNFRKETGTQLYFTLDAGPNIHLIYKKEDEIQVKSFIEMELAPLSEKVIFDHVGLGPQKTI
jgi:diphosphomevalonate decarboxylase